MNDGHFEQKTQADEQVSAFIEEFKKSHQSNTLIKVLLSKPLENAEGPAKVQIRPVLIKQGKRLSFILEYPTTDL